MEKIFSQGTGSYQRLAVPTGAIVGYVGLDDRFAPWWWQNNDPSSGVVEVGGGVVQAMASTGEYANNSPWQSVRLQVQRIVFTDPGTVGSFNLTSLFRNLPNLVEIQHIDYINLADTRWLSNIFRDAVSLARIGGLENWDTSAVQRFTGMFRGTSFTVLNLSSFDTRSITRFDSMFRDMHNLERIIGMETFDTNSATTLGNMFRGASAIVSLDLSRWNTSRVASGEGFASAFQDMTSLRSLNLAGWDTRQASAAQLANMFAGDTALRVLTLGENWSVASGGVGPNLPAVPSAAPYIGTWQNVAGGTVNNPRGTLFYTSPELMTASNAARNTWVWAREASAPAARPPGGFATPMRRASSTTDALLCLCIVSLLACCTSTKRCR